MNYSPRIEERVLSSLAGLSRIPKIPKLSIPTMNYHCHLFLEKKRPLHWPRTAGYIADRFSEIYEALRLKYRKTGVVFRESVFPSFIPYSVYYTVSVESQNSSHVSEVAKALVEGVERSHPERVCPLAHVSIPLLRRFSLKRKNPQAYQELYQTQERLNGIIRINDRVKGMREAKRKGILS